MAQSGSLGVQVYVSRAQIPIAGATVVITQRAGNGKQKVLSLQETDRNGNIRTVSVPTPPTGDSTQPSGGDPPFTSCDIWIEHPMYELLLVEGVQIFPGVESLQQAELTPLVRGESWTERPNIRAIPGQDL